MDSTHAAPSAAKSLHMLLASNHEIAEFINEVAKLAATEVIDEPDANCGILLRREKRLTVVGHSNQTAKDLDEIQAGFEEGPCLQAQLDQTVIISHDVRHETRWPDYILTLRASDIRSVLAVPLSLGDTASAAMNFYAHEPNSFREEDIDHALDFASLTSLAVTVALRIAAAAEAAKDRQQAMESRTAIDVAVGIIMAQQQCSQQEAFDMLAEVSNLRNVKVRDLARELVESIGKTPQKTTFDH